MKVDPSKKIVHRLINVEKTYKGEPLLISQHNPPKHLATVYPWKNPQMAGWINLSVLLDGYATRDELASVIGGLLAILMRHDSQLNIAMTQEAE